MWRKLFISIHPGTLLAVVHHLRLDNIWHVRLTRANARRAQRLLQAALLAARRAGPDVRQRTSVCACELLLLLASATQPVYGRAHLPPALQRALDAALVPERRVRSVAAMAHAAHVGYAFQQVLSPPHGIAAARMADARTHGAGRRHAQKHLTQPVRCLRHARTSAPASSPSAGSGMIMLFTVTLPSTLMWLSNSTG